MERRKSRRVVVDLPARLTIPGGSGKFEDLTSCGGRVINISRDGLAIEIYVSPRRDILLDTQIVSLEITLPDSRQPVTLRGEAIWGTKIENPFLSFSTLRIGVRIRDISPADKERLFSHIQYPASENS